VEGRRPETPAKGRPGGSKGPAKGRPGECPERPVEGRPAKGGPTKMEQLEQLE
jgi:hypothetical protein